jgi:mono/diheme cytochrome c family protein
MRRLLAAAVILGILGATTFYILTMPRTVDAAALPNHTPDLANGETMFYAGGCSSCHAAPASEKCDDHKTADKHKLAGGRCLVTGFGTFYVPNISPDPETGIGGWSDIDFVNAMVRGVSPKGAHYYPAFPYTSYQRMRYGDLLDLKAFLDTLPAVKSQVPDHDLALPFRWRRSLGLWKLIYLDGKPFSAPPGADEKLSRGAYLVEGPGHCGECHSPRDALGGTLEDTNYSGAPAPEGKGYIPNITPDKTGIGDWSEDDIVEALSSGFTPSFDSFGGTMVAVQENLAKLPPEERVAIAAYLKSLPPVASKPRNKDTKAGDG